MGDTETGWRKAVEYWPNGWRVHLSNLRRAYYVAIPFVVLSGVFLLLGVKYAEIRMISVYVAMGIGGLLSLTIGTVRWYRRTIRRWRTSSISNGRFVLIAPMNPVVWQVRAGVLGVGAVAAVLAPWLIEPIAGGSQRQQVRGEIFLSVMPVIGIALACYVTLLLLSSRRYLGLGVSVSGVHHWSWGGCSFYPWDEIRRFRPSLNIVPGVWMDLPKEFRAPGDPEESMLGRVGWYRRKPGSFIPLAALDVHPVIAYEVLRFYQRNPELREELGTKESLRRIWEGDFPGVVEELRKEGERGNPT